MRTTLDFIARLQEGDDRRVFAYDRRGQRLSERSHAELARRARATGASFLESGLRPGEHVFLQLPSSFELIEGFLGAIAAGLVPCCLAPPRAHGGVEVFQERMRSLLEQFPSGRLVARPEVGDAAGVPYLATPDLPDDEALAALAELVPLDPPEPLDPESLAFIQLTSGSTRHPRVVCISHRALIANVKNLTASSKGTPADSVVTWLPLYHDMGLVGSLLTALGTGCDLHVMQPETFLARPRAWLRIIGEVPGPVISIAPNFAFQSCVDRISVEEVAGLDLSRWRLAGCGAERVRPDTLDAFARHFAPAGFRKEAFVPCYGMAEATLAVTFSSGGQIPTVDRGNVSCGPPMPETEVVIRSPQGEPLPEGGQGEVTVKSTSLFSGYAGGDHASPVRDGWLYTGDRGYLLGGELYLTGRYKDLIIVDGVNIDPDEIEGIAEDTVEGVGGRAGAFSVDVEGRERVVLVSETAPQPPEVFEEWNREIGDRVARLFGFTLYDMVFVRRGALSKTSSGKVQRTKLRASYEEETLETLWRQRDLV